MSGRLVSVIVPFLNGEKFLPQAIESIFAQSCSNWELLLVDDGSRDKASNIAREYAERSPTKVRYLEHPRHENRGACASRNLGVRSSRGDYIALLDADDVWLSHKLERQVAILDSQPKAAMVYGTPQFWYSWSGDPSDLCRDSVPGLGVEPNTLIEPPLLLKLTLESKAPTPCPSDVLLRKEAIERVSGFEERFQGPYQLFEDQAFFAKITLTAHVFAAGECWHRYRQHPHSCVSVVTAAGQKGSVALFYLDWLAEYLAGHDVRDASLWQALGKKRWRYCHPTLHHLLARSHHYLQWMNRLPERLKNGFSVAAGRKRG